MVLFARNPGSCIDKIQIELCLIQKNLANLGKFSHVFEPAEDGGHDFTDN